MRKNKDGVSLIGSDIEVTGSLSATAANAILFVNATERIEGELNVANVVINGAVEGDIHADGRIELAPRAKVRGNLHYQRLEIRPGAVLDGQLIPGAVADTKG